MNTGGSTPSESGCMFACMVRDYKGGLLVTVRKTTGRERDRLKVKERARVIAALTMHASGQSQRLV